MGPVATGFVTTDAAVPEVLEADAMMQEEVGLATIWQQRLRELKRLQTKQQSFKLRHV